MKSMLQAIASRAGIEIDFEEESSYSDDSEYENEEGEGEEGEGEEGKEGGEEKEGGKEEGRKEGDGARGGETKREEEGETNSERGNGEEKRAEEGEQEEENRVATVNCGTDESQSRKISSEKGGLCSNTKTSLTSSEQVSESPKPTAPPPCEDPSSVAVNGVLDDDAENNGHAHGKAEGQCERGGTDGKGPCGKNSTEDIGDCKSQSDEDDSSRTETTQSPTEDGRLSRNHTLLGLLTSAISRPQNHRVSCMYHNYGISIAC